MKHQQSTEAPQQEQPTLSIQKPINQSADTIGYQKNIVSEDLRLVDYCVVADVKAVLQIDLAQTSMDSLTILFKTKPPTATTLIGEVIGRAILRNILKNKP